jgi:hypothetical protein
MKTRIRTTFAVLAAAVVAVVGSAPAAAGEYVPFVTDFPQQQERYVPFVTDFPRPATPAPEAGPSPLGIDWSGPPLTVVGSAVAAALALGVVLVLSRRQPGRPRASGC